MREQLSNPAISGVDAAKGIIDLIENLRQVEIAELNKKYATKVEQIQQVQTGLMSIQIYARACSFYMLAHLFCGRCRHMGLKWKS